MENNINTNASNNDKYFNNSLNLIDDYSTHLEKNKIPFKKMNFKLLSYKRRLKYGRLEKMGLAKDDLRFLPELEIIKNNHNTNENKNNSTSTSIVDLINVDSSYYNKNSHNSFPLDENFFFKLIYNSDLEFNIKQSKREIHLRNMLENRLKRLLELNK